MRRIGASYRTAWHLKHNLMHVIPEREGTILLADSVEIDDAYFGY